MSKGKGFFGVGGKQAAKPDPVVLVDSPPTSPTPTEIKLADLEPEIIEHIRRLHSDGAYRARFLAQIKAESAAAKFAADNAPKALGYVPKSKDDPRYYWAKDRAMPKEYVRGNMPPCKICRAIRLDNSLQAVRVYKTDPVAKVAEFTCRRCGGKFEMDIAKGPY
jgi:hypothetical protein